MYTLQPSARGVGTGEIALFACTARIFDQLGGLFCWVGGEPSLEILVREDNEVGSIVWLLYRGGFPVFRYKTMGRVNAPLQGSFNGGVLLGREYFFEKLGRFFENIPQWIRLLLF